MEWGSGGGGYVRFNLMPARETLGPHGMHTINVTPWIPLGAIASGGLPATGLVNSTVTVVIKNKS